MPARFELAEPAVVSRRLAAISIGIGLIAVTTFPTLDQDDAMGPLQWSVLSIVLLCLVVMASYAVANAFAARGRRAFYSAYVAAACVWGTLAFLLHRVVYDFVDGDVAPLNASRLASGLVSIFASTLAVLAIEQILDRLSRREHELTKQFDIVGHAYDLAITDHEERLRDIAEFLHGTVQSRLLVAELRLGDLNRRLQSDADHTEMKEIIGILSNIRENEVRNMSHILHPAAVRFGIVPALMNLAERFAEDHSITVHVAANRRLHDLDLSGELPETLRLTLYRATEEGLSNARRHGGATAVNVGLHAGGDGQITLRVIDNGLGLSDEMAEGLGLCAIQLRAKSRGGSCVLYVNELGGATMEVVVRIRTSGVRDGQRAMNGYAPERRRNLASA